ncbi:Hypothetical protein FKW44_010588 [Caligus rogercresseyi]|uniref:Uncharacterized protein n=1 Tax=Caligus rogercresseyi TaxID=217165 RepID=A0A7T8HHC4_CALRO|nr:Hypothetical protein FKW44_010588 [Caligus rogercresseyi]
MCQRIYSSIVRFIPQTDKRKVVILMRRSSLLDFISHEYQGIQVDVSMINPPSLSLPKHESLVVEEELCAFRFIWTPKKTTEGS